MSWLPANILLVAVGVLLGALLAYKPGAAGSTQPADEVRTEGGLLPGGVRKIDFTIEVREDAPDACMAWPGMKERLKPGHFYLGCARWTPDFQACHVIFAPDVDNATVRHELAHCLKGHWH